MFNSELEELQSIFSDFDKEVHGFRPRWMSNEQWNSIEWLGNAIRELEAEAKVVFAAEAEAEQINIKKFEETVSAVIAAGAKDRETALRWMMDGSDANGDWQFYCYLCGLPYDYFNKENF